MVYRKDAMHICDDHLVAYSRNSTGTDFLLIMNMRLALAGAPRSMHNQLRIILMDITLSGLLCIRIILGWLRIDSPFPWVYKVSREMDTLNSLGRSPDALYGTSSNSTSVCIEIGLKSMGFTDRRQPTHNACGCGTRYYNYHW